MLLLLLMPPFPWAEPGGSLPGGLYPPRTDPRVVNLWGDRVCVPASRPYGQRILKS